MTNNFKFSSKMHLCIVITSVLVAIGLAVGLVFHFVFGSFYNWGGDYSTYYNVEVQYSVLEIKTKDVENICEEAFEANGITYYTVVTSGSSTESRIEYRFNKNTDASALSAARSTIKTQVQEKNTLAVITYSYVEGTLGGEHDIMYAGIALAAVVVFQFLYFIIRYKLTMALSALLANVHNLALFYALLAITRVQVSSSVVALSVLTVLLTVIGCGILFEKMRKAFRTDEYKAMSSFEQADGASRMAVKPMTFLFGAFAVAALVLTAFTALGSLSIYSLFMPCMCALISVVASAYGVMLFTPAVYSRIKLRGDIYVKNKAGRYVGTKKTAKAAE